MTKRILDGRLGHMENLYTSDPLSFWMVLYSLFYVYLLIHEWEQNNGMNIRLALYLLLWPLLCAFGLLVAVVVGIDWLWRKLFAKKGEKE